MVQPGAGVHEHWSSRFAFLMAAIGSSVGLGNFWRFPFTAGENGGGAFIIIYLFCVALVAFPALVAEYVLGRRGGYSAVGTIGALAQESGRSRRWEGMGWLGILTSLFIVTFYSVVAGWVIAYAQFAFSGDFASGAPEEIQAKFSELTSNPGRQLLYHAAFVALTVFIIARGIKRGIEAAVKFLMPAFFIMLLGVVAYALIEGDVGQAASFLLRPDFSQVTFTTVQVALGQALFSVGVGSVLMMTYGAYLNPDQNIVGSSGFIAFSDSLVAIIAGFAIFPLVFATGLDPAGGPGLFFQTLPVAFSQVPGGSIVAGVFFLLALFAAVTSSISLMETGASWAEEQTGLNRRAAAVVIGVCVFMMGAGSAYSLQYLDFVDFVTGSIMLPLGAMLVAIFAGWVVKREHLMSELSHASPSMRNIWYILVKFVVPVGVAVILVGGLANKFFS
ncbi:sodium-dependent transporter [Euryhalocaulis caribicus]|uniref:sodium-dependent transporter n=1 Tax=Euryhalocaulis caribicus TaxID=1161401 RepID=UPI0003A5CE1B|nr:sodium-dependent transporter [Euryhalocaulis caribicus]